jgi:AraC family transcriptional regulator, regulatory protein of adaptative response / DNA-3-methyladenine glycosylase II
MRPVDVDERYLALRARDRRFDGVFFVGVTSTGVYCRPVCPSRTPTLKRCRFFHSPANAEAAGFRPCLRCRPELAPHQRTGATAPAQRLADALRTHRDAGPALAELAAQQGLSPRHLRRLFTQVYGLAPIAYAQTQRLLFAKQLLHETSLPIIEVAMSAGFGSVRRFNHLFRQRYRLAPSAVRRRAEPASDTVKLRLDCAAPLHWPSLRDFFTARAIAGVERVEVNRYLRTVRLGECSGWVAVSPRSTTTLEAEVSTSLTPVLMPLLRGLRDVFDCDVRIDEVLAQPALNALYKQLSAPQALRVPGAFSAFEIIMRAIVGQRISVRAAATVLKKLTEALGAPCVTPVGLSSLLPTAADVAAAPLQILRQAGLPLARASTLQTVAQAVSTGTLQLDAVGENQTLREALLQVPGIGRWTVEYLALRAWRWPDAFPAGDLVLQRMAGAGNERQLERLAEAWRPWRGYAAMALWWRAAQTERAG